jgi:hypothetical protein
MTDGGIAAQELSKEFEADLLASEESPVAKGVAETSRIDGVREAGDFDSVASANCLDDVVVFRMKAMSKC